jgi:3-oxoacyl-[acyl-carrier protein] reductase
MSTPLVDQVAFVTGGSRGIGAAIVRRLAREGAIVAFTYSSSAAAANAVASSVSATGGRAVALHADSGQPEQLSAALADVARRHGRLDILVNNAGIAGLKPAVETSLDEFDRLMAVNLRAVFVGSREAVTIMRATGRGGRIITIGSTLGERAGFPGTAVYAASKAAVSGFTRGLAREVGRDSITVNVVEPGPIDTELNPADGPGADMQRAMLATPRFGRAEEVAAMVTYLAGPEAAFITGASFLIDGGFAA